MLALTPAFIADINQTPIGSNPGEVVVVGDVGYFTAYDPVHGTELWRTDGTAAGTALVADLDPGPYPAGISTMTAAAGRLFFLANSVGTYSTSIWTVDPATGDAVELVSDVATPFYGGDTDSLGLLGDEVLFWRQIYDGSLGSRELWKTDGTTAGTQPVKMFTGYFGFDDVPRFSPAAGGRLYFAFHDGVSGVGREPWSTDGTAGGTALVKDIRAGAYSSYPSFIGSAGDTILFTATDGLNGVELWRTDPVVGAALVADLNASSESSNPVAVVAVGETLFVQAVWFGNRMNVWRIDDFRGAAPQVTHFEDLEVTGSLALAGGHVYFAADDGVHGVELWRAAVAGGDPELVKDIYAPFATGPFVVDTGIPPITEETEPNDSLVQADDLRGSFGLIGADTYMAFVDGQADVVTSPGDWFRIALPAGYQLEVQGSPGIAQLYDASGAFIEELSRPFVALQSGDFYVRLTSFSSQPTGFDDYTVVFEVSVAAGDAEPSAFTVIGDTLYFTARDSAHGTEVWRTDPVAGAVLVGDLNPGPGSSLPTALTPVGNELFLRANGSELWRASVAGGATKVATDLNEPTYGSGSYGAMAVLDGTLLFPADDGTTGAELWALDTTSGATAVLEVAEGNEGSMQGSLGFSARAILDGVLYFTANGGEGYELWRSDGTSGGTSLVADIAPGSFGSSGGSGSYPRSSFPLDLTVLGDVLFFSADGDFGRELWKTGGTAASTLLVADINSGSASYGGPASSSPFDLTPVGSTLYFSADDGGGRRLWKTDGTTTQKVAGVNVAPQALVAFDGDLYFTGTDSTSGNELRRLDVETGTVQVFDLTPGTGGSNIYDVVVAGDSLLFYDSGFPQSLWRFVPAAGAAPASRELIRTFDGIASFRRVDGKSAVQDGILFFVADDGTNGLELWRTDGTAAGTAMVKDIFPGGSYVSSDPSGLTVVGDLLYFAALDASGYRLWQSDGTGTGTVPVVLESIPGDGDGPGAFEGGELRVVLPLGLVGSSFLVAADDGGPEGVELWSLSSNASAGAVIGTTGSLAALSTLLGTASSPATVAVTGSNLTAAIVATAPAEFEVSSDGTTFGPTASFAPSGGAVSGTLSVRLAATAAVGTYAGTVSLTSTGATAATVAIPSSTVTDELVFDVALGQTVTHAVARTGAIKYLKRGPGTLVLSGASAHTGQTTVEAGTLVVAVGDALASSAVRVTTGGTLKVNAGVTMRSPTVTLAGGTLDGAGAVILVNAASGIGTFTITSGAVTGSPSLTVSGNGVVALPTDRRQVVALSALSVDQAVGGGRIDIGRGRIDVATGGITEAALRADVVAGRSGGSFAGATGIMTTGGVAGAAAQPVVGYRVLSSGAAIVAWAAFGDANLDGQLSNTDVSLINNGGKFGQGAATGATWAQGDFNYSGGVTNTDISLLNNAGLFNSGSYLPVAPSTLKSTSSTGSTGISPDLWIAYAIDAETQKAMKR